MKLSMIVIIAAVATLQACSSNPNAPTGNIQLPAWVISPSVKNGMAESACVNWTGHLSVDKDEATAIARNRLVQQIELRAANLTKTFANKTNVNGGTSVGTNFETNARQIAEGALKGSRATKTDVFDIDQRKQLCVLVTVEAQNLDAIANQLIGASNAKLSNDDKAVLKEQFKAQQGQEELNKAL